jgi:predicted DNA binding CopG/RHH family protein
MSKPMKPIPDFADEAEERAFWGTNDSTDYLNWGKAKPVRLPNLKPTTKTISLRLPIAVLERIRSEANRRDVPYQSLIKAWLAEDLDRLGR